MINPSIYAAFERMWQHIVSALGNKANRDELADYATQNFVKNEIANAQLSGGEGSDVDLSGYATKDELNEKFTDVVYSSEEDGAETTVPMDADTLGGLPASEYATSNYVKNEIANAQLGGGGDVDLSGLATKDELTVATNGLQTQLNGKQDAITRDLIPGMVALCSQTDGKITTSSIISTTELGYLDGVTSNIQDQFKDTYSLTATGTAIAENDDLDSYTTPGIYSCALAVSATLANNPHPTAGFKLIVQRGYSASRFIQELYTGVANGVVWRRFYAGSVWGEWKRVMTSLSDMGVTATATELNYVDGVTSSIQTQLNGKQDAITGLTSGMVMICNSSGKIATSSVVSTAELGYLDGVTSNIQDQFSETYKMSSTGTAIPSSANLNTYMTPGIYSSASGTVSGTLTNSPITSTGFKLIVEYGYSGSSRIIQTAYGTSTVSPSIYYRFFANNTWSSWARPLFNILNSSDYGTSLPTTATEGRIFFKKVT